MAYLTIREAAEKLGTDEETIHEWIQHGWLKNVHTQVSVSTSGNLLGAAVLDQLVDEEELFEVAEEVGWAMLVEEAFLDRLEAHE
ncbi:MAG: hypothetical protein SNJ72_05070 [Fimbriimonadales bacterium]